MSYGIDDEICKVLLRHYSMYPYMEVQDAVKLLYQSEFGCGHMVKDFQAVYSQLAHEYESVRQTQGVLLEDIGNGFSRINLRSLNAYGITTGQVLDWFVTTANTNYGLMDRFENTLSILTENVVGLPFEKDEVEQFIKAYALAGYPLVHHSARYRAAYSPAYRVIRTEYANACLTKTKPIA